MRRAKTAGIRAAAPLILVAGLSLAAGPVLAGKGPESAFHASRLIVKLDRDLPGLGVQALASGARLFLVETLPGTRIHVMEPIQKGESVAELIDEISGSPIVEFAEPDYLVYPSYQPNDPELGAQWALEQMDAAEAWDTTRGDPGVVVAVVDTGTDLAHPDLRPNLWQNPGEVQNGLDDDGNGYVDDVHGIDCISGSGDPSDVEGHGTQIAGVIGAVGDNGTGVVGVSPKVRIMSLKFMNKSGGNISDAIECLNYAAMMKAMYGVNVRVVNNSWGGAGPSQALESALHMLDQEDVLVVASAGNDGRDLDAAPDYPASFRMPNLLVVAASDRSDRLADLSNYGQSVQLAAPGVDILSTARGGGYRSRAGTSMAAAQVSGAAALLAAHEPAADAPGLRAVLEAGVDVHSKLDGRVASGGRLNLARSLCAPGELLLAVEPAPGFRAAQHQETIVRARLRDCGVPTTGAFVNLGMGGDGAPDVAMRDDGVAPDEVAGDGLYSASWLPARPGTVTLEVEALASGSYASRSVDGTVLATIPYAVSDTVSFGWIESEEGKELGIRKDDSDASLALGFDFFFYGAVHDKARVSSNGYLTFGTRSLQPTNLPLPSADAPEFLIAPYWDDLDPEGKGRVSYVREGTAPDRSLTIQWTDFGYPLSSATTTFQVTLYERDGRIVFRYLDVSSIEPARDRGTSATVGIQGGLGHFGELYSYTEPALGDGLAIEFVPDENAIPRMLAMVAGHSLRLADRAGRPESRKLLLQMRDENLHVPLVGTGGDPTRWGGWLRLRNPDTGQEAQFNLPSWGWRSSRSGYRYKGPGPCRSLSVRAGSVRAHCKGDQIDFALTEPMQGKVAASLQLGTKALYCTVFGAGSVTEDYGVGHGSGGVGRFSAKRAVPSPICPITPSW